MDADKRRIFFGITIIVFVLVVFFAVSANFFVQKKFQLPDAPDGITSIAVYHSSYWYGNNYKDISDRSGIRRIIDVLQQVKIDFSSPEKRGTPSGGASVKLVLRYEDGTDYNICVLLFGEDKIVIGPEFIDGYYGTWTNAEDFFWDLDYPMIHLLDGELGPESYKGPDS